MSDRIKGLVSRALVGLGVSPTPRCGNWRRRWSSTSRGSSRRNKGSWS